MNNYTIIFYCNGKRYGYKTTNYKMIKKIKRNKRCNVVWVSYFNYNDL